MEVNGQLSIICNAKCYFQLFILSPYYLIISDNPLSGHARTCTFMLRKKTKLHRHFTENNWESLHSKEKIIIKTIF